MNLSDVNLAQGALSKNANGRPVLIGGACKSCGTQFFPQHPVCPSCMSEDVAETAMPTRGKLYSFTTLHVGAKKWNKPLSVGYVDLDNGVRVFAHLQGQHFRFDQQVEMDLGQVGIEPGGAPISTFVFKPTEA